MIRKEHFGEYGGRPVSLYVLQNENIQIGLTDFGAAVQFLKINTPRGEKDVALGYPDIAKRMASGSYCGATVGRTANRISGARFTLDGREYFLSANEGENQNHGGRKGFDKRFFHAETAENKVVFTLVSEDGDQGFPGRLTLQTVYSLQGSAVEIRYTGHSDKRTLWSPTSHIYFNLNGDGNGNILNTLLKINADKFTPVTPAHIPTGEISAVNGTPFDFTNFKPIGKDIDSADEQLRQGNGYDHNFILNGSPAACAKSETSGIEMRLFTDMPCLQFYSGNFLSGTGKSGGYRPYDGFALEAQLYPDGANQPLFPSPVLEKDMEKSYYIRYEFGGK